MSFTVSTPASIVNSPLNNSTSKFQFSFPRAKKLPDPKEPVCTKAFYDLPPTRSNRSAGFGYGTKHDFTKAYDVIPPPGTYSVKDHFSPQGRRGWSIALGRESMSGNGSPENRSPGPAIYDVREKNRTHISFSFRPKTREAQPTCVKAPGPGAYTPAETLNKTGNYFVSKFKSSGVTRFNPGTSKRFIVITDGDKPGPGAYEPQTKLSPKGSYFVSTFRTSLGKSFGGRSNSTSFIQTSSTPGPGSYRLPSDFGHYESATLHRRPRSKAAKKEQ